MADDFKKLSKDFQKLNKSMNLLGKNAESEMKIRKRSNINSTTNPMADARDSFSKISSQAAALGKHQKIQTVALSNLAGYQLGENRQRQVESNRYLDKIQRNTEVQRGWGEMLKNQFTNFFGLMPNRAARKRAAKADETQIRDSLFGKMRTVSLKNMQGIMARGNKEAREARKVSESRLEAIRARRKKAVEKLYREAREQGNTAKEAFGYAKIKEGIQNKKDDLKLRISKSKQKTKEKYEKKMWRIWGDLTMSKEERMEKNKIEEERQQGLVDAFGMSSLKISDEDLEKMGGKQKSFISKMFGWLKKAALISMLGGLLGHWIGGVLGDQVDKVFGENSWLGNLIRNNGWWAGIGAVFLAPMLAKGALNMALGLGAKGLGALASMIGPAIGPLIGKIGGMMGPLGLIAGAGILGTMAGDFLYKSVVGPWIDDFYKRKGQEEAMFDASETKQSTIKLEGGGTEDAYVISQELAAKYQDITGGSTIVGSTAAEEIAKKEEIKGGLAGAAQDPDKSGIRAATYRKEASTGAMISGTEEYTSRSAKIESEEMRQRSMLHDMSMAGKSGINISTVEGIKHVSEEEGRYAKLKFDFLKVGETLRRADNLVAKVIGKGSYNDENLDLTEQGLEKELISFQKLIKPRLGGIIRDAKKLPKDDPLRNEIVNAYNNLISHFNPTSWSILNGRRNEYVDAVGSQIGIYGEGNNFYSKGGAGGYFPYSKAPTLLLKNLFSDPLWQGLPGPTELARGGLVTGPVRALIGEAGPEAVIPLDKAAGVMGAALSKAINTPSMQSLASQQRAESAKRSSKGMPTSGSGSNINIVNNQQSSSFMNFTPQATTSSGPAWIKTLSD